MIVLKNFAKPDQITKLKYGARIAYEHCCAETAHMTCGNALAKYINPRAAKYARVFNANMRELEKIDPNCPKWTPL